MTQSPRQPRPTDSSKGYLPPDALDPESDGPPFDLYYSLDLLRRRWWLALAVGLVVGLGVWLTQPAVRPSPVPMFTAKVHVLLLPMQEQEVLARVRPSYAAESVQRIIDTEVEMLRTRSSLGEVVDAEGLRLVLDGDSTLWSTVFSHVTVAPHAPTSTYRLRRGGGNLHLLSEGRTIVSAVDGDVLDGGGMQLTLAATAAVSEGGVAFSIIPPDSAIDRLAQRSRFERVPDTDLIAIRYDDRDPVLAHRVATALAVAVRDRAAFRARQSRKSRAETTAHQLQRVRDSLATLSAEPPLNGPDRLAAERRLASLERTRDMLTTWSYEAALALETENGRFIVLDSAFVSRVTQGPRRVGAATPFWIGLLAGLGVVAVLDRVGSTLRRPEQVPFHTGLDVVGTIPRITGKLAKQNQLPIPTTPASVEAFSMVGTNLHFLQVEPPGLIAITSGGPREGKSFVAANLAVSYARHGMNVLLVDADLRRPQLHTTFGRNRSPGLSEALVDGNTPSVTTCNELGLDLVPAGAAVSDPAGLVGGQAFRDFLEGASDRYDLVVVDTPPVLVAPDASLIASAVGGTVLVVRQGVTSTKVLVKAHDQLGRSAASILGVVVNGVETWGGRFGTRRNIQVNGYAYRATDETGGV